MQSHPRNRNGLSATRDPLISSSHLLLSLSLSSSCLSLSLSLLHPSLITLHLSGLLSSREPGSSVLTLIRLSLFRPLSLPLLYPSLPRPSTLPRGPLRSPSSFIFHSPIPVEPRIESVQPPVSSLRSPLRRRPRPLHARSASPQPRDFSCS